MGLLQDIYSCVCDLKKKKTKTQQNHQQKKLQTSKP